VNKPQEAAWTMAGANPERTSWTQEAVRGKLKPLWFKPFEAYILQRVQIIAENDTLYISTANGLYALDAESGQEKWVYPTELPLGHSPTISKGIAYVGGFDHKLHAVDARTGRGLWKFEAGAGFDTNPLVVDDKVYAGNRDGNFYAISTEGSNAGQIAWKFKTGGPIHFSAAYAQGVVYFASNDSHAYALDAETGSLIWKSQKLPGSGFHSWWPVIYHDWVVFAGSNNYRFGGDLGPGGLHDQDEEYVYPNRKEDEKGVYVGPEGNEPGDWATGTRTIDTSKPNTTSNGSTNPITTYFETYPWRRTFFVLNRTTGQEYTTDFDQDGRPEYAPMLWFGTKGAGNRYPPVVGSDGVIYTSNNYMSDYWIAGGQVSGWKIGTPFISVVNSGWNAVDEPLAYAAGGDLIYWNRCCDRAAGAVDISVGDTDTRDRAWSYFTYDLPERVPGYNVMVYPWTPYYKPYGGVFGGRNGVYGFHGDVNPPVPYKGKVYMHRSNAIIAFTPEAGDPVELPAAKIVAASHVDLSPRSDEGLKNQLASEIEKMLAAGHLRPGYTGSGIFDLRASSWCGDDLVDYWHHPADTIYTLIRALPHLPPDLQSRVRDYLNSEFQAYPIYRYNHIGWEEGQARESFETPPEVAAAMSDKSPENRIFNFDGWKFNPYAFYAMWKYAQVFGEAKSIFDAAEDQLEPVPADSLLAQMPHVHNAYIAGYLGYLELQKLAGYPESQQVRAELNRLLALRAQTFSKDTADKFFEVHQYFYCRTLNLSRNFLYLVPELADYLQSNARGKVEEALDEYQRVAPYWFVARLEVTFAEGVIQPLHDTHAIFQARALILGDSRAALSPYLDVPAFPVGDLYYIDNLVSLLEAGQ
jgi:hypothetical protein